MGAPRRPVAPRRTAARPVSPSRQEVEAFAGRVGRPVIGGPSHSPGSSTVPAPTMRGPASAGRRPARARKARAGRRPVVARRFGMPIPPNLGRVSGFDRRSVLPSQCDQAELDGPARLGDPGSIPLEGLALVELEVALVAAGVDLAPVDGVLDGAVGLVDVRAVGELAVRDVGPELDEVGLDLARLDVPELELAEARGVDDVAARLEPDQLGGGGGVLPLGGPVGDLADPEVQARLDRVEQRALADAALARERRRPLGRGARGAGRSPGRRRPRWRSSRSRAGCRGR